jgi:hypothetical protein
LSAHGVEQVTTGTPSAIASLIAMPCDSPISAALTNTSHAA